MRVTYEKPYKPFSDFLNSSVAENCPFRFRACGYTEDGFSELTGYELLRNGTRVGYWNFAVLRLDNASILDEFMRWCDLAIKQWEAKYSDGAQLEIVVSASE